MNEIIASPQIGQFLWSALMTTVGVLGLLACEKKDFQIGRWFFKPMAAVGFVGAAESKVALARASNDIPFLAVHGTRGGSAMASSVVNALAIAGGGDSAS